MRFKSFTLAVCVWAAVCATHAETLVVLGDDAYSPVVYTDQGKPAGILPTILTRISALRATTTKCSYRPGNVPMHWRCEPRAVWWGFLSACLRSPGALTIGR